MNHTMRLTPDGCDVTQELPVVTAIRHLAEVHGLPRRDSVDLQPSEYGHPLVYIALRDAAEADQWRAAFGAPAYTRRLTAGVTCWETERFWHGVTIHLFYTVI